ncbi:MAG TPA: hemolysin family protein [Alphaproteobacteria bacterium]|nr:hemolysin family protein [Alphaproteobacteria bacterium]
MGLVKSHLNLRDQEIVPTNGNSNSEQQQAIMRQNIMELHDRHVSDVMRPRADIVAVELNTPLAELLKIIVANPYSRLPVYREELDDILGIIHIKDILDSMVNEAKFDLGRLIRATKFVVPSMPVLDLLLQMRQTRMQMAMVIDEYGGIDGLVTIEDLLEQIVGDIEDERDLAAPQMMELSQGVWISDARLSLRDFEKTVGSVLQEEEQEESDTLGGLIVYLADRVPRRGETITHDAGFAFDILEADNRRVKRVRIRKVEPQPTGE